MVVKIEVFNQAGVIVLTSRVFDVESEKVAIGRLKSIKTGEKPIDWDNFTFKVTVES